MKFIFSLILLLLIGLSSFSQNYTRDVGIRTGDGFFVSYRQFYNEELAMEAFVGFSENSFRVTGLREYFRPIARLRSDNLRLISGYGIHTGIAYTNKYKMLLKEYYHDWQWSPHFGIDGIIGIEYTASEFPVLISAALQPYFEYSLNHYFSVQPFEFIILIKYRF